MSVWNIFEASFDINIINDSVYFINKSSNYENCVWDFGDFNLSFDENPSHVYSQAGTYNVSLSCYSNSGCLIDIFTSQVNINITSLENSSSSNKKIIKSFDINGREVDEKTRGVLFQINNIGEVIIYLLSCCI